MSFFNSACLNAWNGTANVGNLTSLMTCPYTTALTFPGFLGVVTGTQIFYFLLSLSALTMIQLRTQSFAFTALVLFVCGTALITLYPPAWVQIGLMLVMLAFSGLLLKIYQDRQ